MGIMDSIKGMFGGGRRRRPRTGSTRAADVTASKIGHADKVDKAADVAKDAVDKLPD